MMRSRLLFNAIILALVAVAIFLEFKPYLTTPNIRLDEVQALDQKIQTVPPENVIGMLLGNDRPVMLVIYTSWCPVCAQVMPPLAQMIREQRLRGVIPVFVSLDSHKRELSKYLVYHDYVGLFAPYILESSLWNGLPSLLQSATGSGFSGAIPYIGFFDSDGKMLSEIEGLTGTENILSLAEKASKSFPAVSLPAPPDTNTPPE